MIERHYDDDALLTMLASAAGTATDPHLRSCGECTEKLDTFRIVTETLRDAATWDKREVNEAPNPNTIATLRAFADTMAAEDSAAEAFLADLLAGPRETWMATLAAHPEYRTPGTVRRLIAATDRALDTMPADAVELTALAVEIAENLTTPRSDTLARLRGAAWRERAYALFYTGQFAEAERAVGAAERAFAGCVVDEYELARVGIVRALVEKGLEHHRPAIDAATTSAETFTRFGDRGRLISARVAAAHARYGVSDFKGAREVLLTLESELRDTDGAETHAMVLANLAYCARELGKTAEAMHYYEQASTLLDDLGKTSESVRLRWNAAAVIAAEGRTHDALVKYRAVRDDLSRLGMTGAAMVVNLEIAELLLMQGDFDAVSNLCKAAMDEFRASGLAHTTRALTALSFMAESARNRTATPQVARAVTEYVRRLPQEPNLLFAPSFD